MLIEDHQNVKKMFKDFEKLKKTDASDEDKSALVEKICKELSVHAQVEEEQDEMFPKVKKAGMDTKAVGAQLAARKAELLASH